MADGFIAGIGCYSARGIEYMLQTTEGLPIDVRFLLPSCVPATPLDEAGAALNWAEIAPFYNHSWVCGLAEMMNFPRVEAGDGDVLQKLLSAHAHGAVLDLLNEGHMDHLLRLAVAQGADPILAVQAAALNTARYFGPSDRGDVAPGRRADMTVADDLTDFSVLRVYCAGRLVHGGNVSPCPAPAPSAKLEALTRDTFHLSHFTPEWLRADQSLAIVGLVPGELITHDLGYADGAHTEDDLLKLAVVERRKGTGHIGLGLLHG